MPPTPPTSSGTDLPGRVAAVLSSTVLNVVVGMAGVAVPVVAWAAENAATKNVLLAVETALLLVLVAAQVWLRKVNIQLRRANDKAMSDPAYFALMRTQLESELIADFGELADGHMQVYASEVPRLSALLLRTLVDAPAEPAAKRVYAVDLTTHPDLLTSRREYLVANRKVIEAGGSIQRLFVCYRGDLVREDFARPLLQLVDHHRSLGVQCGLAVRDNLRAEQAIDYVVVSRSAVLVEEDQGDVGYTRGRSSVYFKSVDRWIGRFESVWGHGAVSAPAGLTDYEAVIRPLLGAGTWDAGKVGECVDQI